MMASSSRLAAHRAAVSASDTEDEPEVPNPAEPGDDDEVEDGADASKKKDKPMTESTDQAALDTARAEGFAAANQRFNTVLASEHYKGRETLAKTLLGNDKLSAEDIVTALESAPAGVPAAAAETETDDTAARAAMANAIAAEQPPATTTAETAEDNTQDDSLVQCMKARFPNAK